MWLALTAFGLNAGSCQTVAAAASTVTVYAAASAVTLSDAECQLQRRRRGGGGCWWRTDADCDRHAADPTCREAGAEPSVDTEPLTRIVAEVARPLRPTNRLRLPALLVRRLVFVQLPPPLILHRFLPLAGISLNRHASCQTSCTHWRVLAIHRPNRSRPNRAGEGGVLSRARMP